MNSVGKCLWNALNTLISKYKHARVLVRAAWLQSVRTRRAGGERSPAIASASTPFARSPRSPAVSSPCHSKYLLSKCTEKRSGVASGHQRATSTACLSKESHAPRSGALTKLISKASDWKYAQNVPAFRAQPALAPARSVTVPCFIVPTFRRRRPRGEKWGRGLLSTARGGGNGRRSRAPQRSPLLGGGGGGGHEAGRPTTEHSQAR